MWVKCEILVKKVKDCVYWNNKICKLNLIDKNNWVGINEEK